MWLSQPWGSSGSKCFVEALNCCQPEVFDGFESSLKRCSACICCCFDAGFNTSYESSLDGSSIMIIITASYTPTTDSIPNHIYNLTHYSCY